MTSTPHDLVYFLLVDDLEENLLSLEAVLRRENLVLLKVRSGAEALELLLKYEVALALLDVQMPVMDGFELAELMRGTERTKRVPIMFLTAGSADSKRRFRGYEAGAVDFLQKPIEIDILRSKASVFFDLYLQRQQVARQRDELEMVAGMNARLLAESRQYAAALKEADIRKDEFLATLAHELRNPLSPISNGLHILRMSPAASNVEQVQEMMDRQLTHLVRLIDDLLDVSRISLGKIDLRKESITLQNAIQAAIEASRPYIEKGKHSLTQDIAAECLWVEADLTRLAQIINNLLNNAAKYTPENGKISISLRKEGEEAVIKVTGNGLGIEPSMLPKIFELFTQVSNSQHSHGGLGIGLALAKQLTEMHKGTITAESSGLGKGCVFTLRLPLIANVTTVPMLHPVEEVSAAAPLQVLVVDDNIASAQTTAWALEMIGYCPTMVHDGLEALEMAKKLQPDVILMDIGLPGMDGYNVCRELRKDPRFKETAIIAQTGWGQQRDREEASEAGFDYHLIKPVKLDELSNLLTSLCLNEVS